MKRLVAKHARFGGDEELGMGGNETILADKFRQIHGNHTPFSGR